MTKQKKKGNIAVIGMALFAMFFGAGNLIFPPYLGLISGKSWGIGLLCFVLVDVGMACVAVFAMSRGDGTIASVTGIIGRKTAVLINTAIVVCIGPLLAIPRTAATTFEMAALPLVPESANYRAVFYIAFFLVAFLLTIRKSKVVDIVGKFLTPVMVIALAILIFKGIFSPIGEIQPGVPYTEAAQEGIIAGYQTMDILAALAFAIIIISSVHEKGYKETRERNWAMMGACIIAGAGLTFVYGGLTYLGATVSGQYDSLISQAELIMEIIRNILGYRGMQLLGIVVGLACMTTAIGLISASASYFEELFKGKVNYRVIVTVITLFSIIISNFGLSTIIQIANPILNLVYPVVVTLILCSFLSEDMKKSYFPKGAALGALLTSVCIVLESFGVEIGALNMLPLNELGLEWMLPAVVFGLVGVCIQKCKKNV